MTVAAQRVLAEIHRLDVVPVHHIAVDLDDVHVLEDEMELDLVVEGDDGQGVLVKLFESPVAGKVDHLNLDFNKNVFFCFFKWT